MAQSWAKMASNLDSNPKIIKAGRLGREVFLFALRVNADGNHSTPGLIPGQKLEPWYIAKMLDMPIEEAETGVKRCETAGLFHREGQGWALSGWGDWGASSDLSTARVRAHREKKRSLATNATSHETGETLHETSETVRNTDKKRREEKKNVSEVDADLARVLIESVVRNLPNGQLAKATDSIKAKRATQWADHFRLMREVDGLDPVAIRSVLDWSQSDQFWKANVLSGDALRRNFDKLLAAMNRGSEKAASGSPFSSRYQEPDEPPTAFFLPLGAPA